MRILIVDDEDSFRLALKSVFEHLTDYQVVDCWSGEEALKLLNTEHFDVVLLDHKMPGVSGLNVLQQMHEQKMETPVIMLTAAGTETVAVEAMKLGAYDYMRKELIDIQHLPIAVNGVYERYLFRKERREREQNERAQAGKRASSPVSETMVNAISQIMENALLIVSIHLQEFEEQMMASVVPGDRERFTRSLADIRQEFAVLASGLKSIIELSKESAPEVGVESGAQRKASTQQVNAVQR